MRSDHAPILNPRPSLVDRQLARWESLRRDLDHPAVELDIETFAPLLATFRALQRNGIGFDPMFVTLMGVLERQAFHSGDDSDSDAD